MVDVNWRFRSLQYGKIRFSCVALQGIEPALDFCTPAQAKLCLSSLCERRRSSLYHLITPCCQIFYFLHSQKETLIDWLLYSILLLWLNLGISIKRSHFVLPISIILQKTSLTFTFLFSFKKIHTFYVVDLNTQY